MNESQDTSKTTKFNSQLIEFGINPSVVHRNLPVKDLVEIAIKNIHKEFFG